MTSQSLWNYFSAFPSALIGYFIGSIPTGYWLGRMLRGIDVRKFGSGNLGATNVFRVLGWPAGLATLFIDILKGYVAVTLQYFFCGMINSLPGQPLPWILGFQLWIGGIFAILGHSFSPFVNFRGGKGVATAAGVFVALLPFETTISICTFIFIFFLSRIVSLSSIVAACALALSTFLITHDVHKFLLTFAVAIFIIWRHRSNIGRLLNGTEPSISLSPTKAMDSRLRPRE